MALDDDERELLERRLSERVEETVRRRLFRFYAVAGAAVIFVLGFVSYDIVERASSKADEAVKELVEHVEGAVRDASVQAEIAKQRLQDVDEYVRRGEQKLGAFEDRGAEIFDRVTELDGQIDQRMGSIHQRLAEAQERIETTAQQIESQRARAENVFAGAGNVEELAASLAELARQVQSLDERLLLISQSLEGSLLEPASGPETAAIGDIVDAAERQSAAEEVGATTVFVQFAGVTRAEAQDLAARLGALGYQVPPVDREESALGKHEVRYFFDEDRPSAEQLAQQTTQALLALGYVGSEIRAVSLVDYKGQKPRRGVLELWIEPVPR